MADEGNEGTPQGNEGEQPGTGTGGEGGQQQAPTLTVDALPEDVRGDSALQPHIKEDGTVDVSGLSKSFVHASQMIGRDKVVVPKEGDDAETWNQFFRSLGRPDTPDAYELPDVSEDAPDVQLDGSWMENFQKKAHELGLSNSQLDGLARWFAQESQYAIEESQSQLEGSKEQAKAELRREYGAQTDEVIEGAKEVLNTFGDDDFSNWVVDSGLGDNPQFVKFLAGIKQQMSEDVFGTAQRRAAGNNLAPADARSRIGELKQDPAYRDAKDPRHKQVMEQINNLYPMAYPEDANRVAVSRDQMLGG